MHATALLHRLKVTHAAQAKEEKQAKRAKLTSKSKLSFADDEEEEEVGQAYSSSEVCMHVACASKADGWQASDKPGACMHPSRCNMCPEEAVLVATVTVMILLPA